MIGNARARTIGQYDGEGRWERDGSPIMAISSGSWTLTTRPCSSSWYLRCHQSSSWVTTGSSSKLWAGVGDGMDHSSERASHGSGPGGGERWARRFERTMLKKNTRTLSAIRKAPIVET